MEYLNLSFEGFWEVSVKLLIALFLGGLIGWEREKKRRTAGLRTHILVCMGSALIMLVSLYIYQSQEIKTGIDPARIAAGVVTGIGFLGAGAIIKSEAGPRGLTTAASVWVSSGIGLAVGCGYMSTAVAGALLAFVTLSGLKCIENRYEAKAKKRR